MLLHSARICKQAFAALPTNSISLSKEKTDKVTDAVIVLSLSAETSGTISRPWETKVEPTAAVAHHNGLTLLEPLPCVKAPLPPRWLTLRLAFLVQKLERVRIQPRRRRVRVRMNGMTTGSIKAPHLTRSSLLVCGMVF